MNTFNQSGQQLNDLRQNVVGLYVQDTYHVTRRAGCQSGPALGAVPARIRPLQPGQHVFPRGF